MNKRLLVMLLTVLLSACTFKRIGPDYKKPAVPLPAHFKEADGWVAAQPADASAREPWWQLFHDPLLNELAPRVAVSNQNIAASVAAFQQAQALVAQQRAALFPTLNLTGAATRTNVANAVTPLRRVRVDLGAAWEPDF